MKDKGHKKIFIPLDDIKYNINKDHYLSKDKGHKKIFIPLDDIKYNINKDHYLSYLFD